MTRIPKSIVPIGKSGDWEVQKFNISKEDADFFNLFNLRQHLNYTSGRAIKPGNYTKLINNSTLIMSDTPAEMRDHFVFYDEAYGNVLINGLGLGLIARALLLKPEVDKLTINEISEDVIKLAGPTLQKEFKGRVVINHTDALTWKPFDGERFNAVWHDIWGEACANNYEEIKKLHRRYGRWLIQPAYNNSWSAEWVRELAKKERRYY